MQTCHVLTLLVFIDIIARAPPQLWARLASRQTQSSLPVQLPMQIALFVLNAWDGQTVCPKRPCKERLKVWMALWLA